MLRVMSIQKMVVKFYGLPGKCVAKTFLEVATKYMMTK